MQQPAPLVLRFASPNDVGTEAFSNWLKDQPLQWSTVVAVRAAMRLIPLIQGPLESVSPVFAANATARLSAKYPNSSMNADFIERCVEAGDRAKRYDDPAGRAAIWACQTAVNVALRRSTKKRDADFRSWECARNAIGESMSPAFNQTLYIQPLWGACLSDFEFLLRGVKFDDLIEAPLWRDTPREFDELWQRVAHAMVTVQTDSSVWTQWYDGALRGRSDNQAVYSAYTDVAGLLPWELGDSAVNRMIESRLSNLKPDPAALEGITSPIAIDHKSDGRIGTVAGPFSLPTVPESSSAQDHSSALQACRSRAAQLVTIASSPSFQGRGAEYAEILGDYIKWLPDASGAGNILLADGEARTLNRLARAEEAVLPTVFMSKLCVLLEDHIGLRSFYPEVARHYDAVNTGHLLKPLPRDAVEAIRDIIRAQTPTVFDETLAPAIEDAAKAPPVIVKLPLEDLPPNDPARPQPPKDPIIEADPLKSRNFTIAAAYNRIWSILQKGKDTSQALEGWRKTYQLLKPHIGAVIDFLHSYGSGGAGGPPPPTIIGS